MHFHDDPMVREEVILKYLQRRLDPDTADAFESHYLSCGECFEELRVSQLIAEGLGQVRVERRYLGDVAVLDFNAPAQLTRRSAELAALSQRIFEQKDTHVLIDLSRVSRIDSAGLGQLMTFYSYAVRQRKALKLLNPSPEVRQLLHITKIDAVLEAYEDEQEALRSFNSQ